ncbi:YigZ family protein [Vagococcus penaei]|uniref:YigZ family protein n=1 Tax=Vagococcus penaei TaxID=633807 RepID=A0A1Q2D4L1_9ENTE|nr:YigZ family protein [Vagococcus penaei]AQP53303.1 YigZ family protein [Vagococcus penaei]RSU04073.1 YigZ family protein [Vagococcus penaei]
MLSTYYTIKQNGSHTIDIKKSQFICSLYRIQSEEDAKEIIASIKKEHWKANHNCSAFVIGDNQDIQRSSDDGEPSGTAGVPMLEVLKVKQLHNVLAVVTRYFGGTKLGAGGLIRAYSQSVSEAIAHIGLVVGKLQQEVHIEVDYATHNKLDYYLQQQTITVKDTSFTDKVCVIAMVDEADKQTFKENLINLLNNQCVITFGSVTYMERPI